MDIVDLIERYYSLFESMDSFDIDPDNKTKLLEEGDSYALKKSVDRGLRWLTDKVSESKLEPIVVTIKDPGDSHDEIIRSLNDHRSLVTLDNVKELDRNMGSE